MGTRETFWLASGSCAGGVTAGMCAGWFAAKGDSGAIVLAFAALCFVVQVGSIAASGRPATERTDDERH